MSRAPGRDIHVAWRCEVVARRAYSGTLEVWTFKRRERRAPPENAAAGDGRTPIPPALLKQFPFGPVYASMGGAEALPTCASYQ